MSTTIENVHQGKWGFYPCDRDVFHKLKKLNKFVEQAIRQVAAWKRWERKEPQNRTIRQRIRNSQGQVVGYQPATPRPEPKLNALLEKETYTASQDRRGNYVKNQRERVSWLTDHYIIQEDYSNARMPRSAPEAVSPLKLSVADIDRLLTICE